MAQVEHCFEGGGKMKAPRIFGAILIALSLFFVFKGTRPEPVVKNRDVAVFIETPSLPELLDDSKTVGYLASAGVEGVVLKPSTMEGLLDGKEATMASGTEILRLFRMEGIVNIYMWEQIKDKPIRLDATYVFTNQLILFETFLSALKQQLGSENVRAYKDSHHDFGGDLPGNYIIEVLATPDEVKSIALGLDRIYRDKLKASGLASIMELASPGDVNAVPGRTPAIFISDTAAAEPAYRLLNPDRVFLAPGVPNLGWKNAVLAMRSSGKDTAPEVGSALIVPLSQVLTMISELKRNGYAVAPIAGASVAEGAKPPSRIFTVPAHLLLLIGSALFFFRILASHPYSVRRNASIGVPVIVALAIGIFSDALYFPETFGGMILVLFTLGLVRFIELPFQEESVWDTCAAISLLLLAGELTSVGRAGFSPWQFSLVALAVAFVFDTQSAGDHRYLLAALALAASGLISDSPLILGLLAAGSGIVVVIGRSSRIKHAAILLTYPAALSWILDRDSSLSDRASMAVCMVFVTIVVLIARRRLIAMMEHEQLSSMR